MQRLIAAGEMRLLLVTQYAAGHSLNLSECILSVLMLTILFCIMRLVLQMHFEVNVQLIFSFYPMIVFKT